MPDISDDKVVEKIMNEQMKNEKTMDMTTNCVRECQN